MKKNVKLRLSRQTVRILNSPELENAIGGDAIPVTIPGGPIGTRPAKTGSISPCCASLWEVCPTE